VFGSIAAAALLEEAWRLLADRGSPAADLLAVPCLRLDLRTEPDPVWPIVDLAALAISR
jgi:hypothetical protein